MNPGIVLGAFCPHPPLLVPQVGGAELVQVQKSQKAMETMAERVREAEPEVVIIISPHAPLDQDAFTMWELPKIEGDFAQFGAPQVALSYEIDLALAAKVAARERKLLRLNRRATNSFALEAKLDHGALVPLYYLDQAEVKVPILVFGMSLLPFPQLYNFGLKIQEAAAELGRRAVIIGSGDLSHRLTAGAPGGYHPQAELFDRIIVDKLAKLDITGLASLDPALVETAGQCGFNSLAILLGAFDGLGAQASVLAYEGPFGVGYATALINTEGRADPARRFAETLEIAAKNASVAKRAAASEEVRLAIEAVEAYVGKGILLEPDEAAEQLQKTRAGAFVTLKKGGQLRGCIGTIRPTKASLAEEIIANAIAAATEDPRFSPLTPEELPYLTYSVDVLGKPEPIASLKELDPKRFGVIVRAGRRQGLLLPDLEGIDSAERQVVIAKQKAGIKPEESVDLFRFQVVRYN